MGAAVDQNRDGIGRPVPAFMEESRMIRRRGTAASRQMRQAAPPAGPASATIDSRSGRSTSAKSTGTVFGGREPTMREIRDRAYYIYLARGGVNGDPVADWVRAERELRSELGSSSPDRRY